METLEKLQHQLESLQGLKSIVRTMKSLAAANIKQYEAATMSLSEFADSIELGLGVVSEDLGETEDVSVETGKSQRALIVFGSDHGLCGRFNENVVDHVVHTIIDAGEAEPPLILAVGVKTALLLEEQSYRAAEIFSAPAAVGKITHTVQQILLTLDDWRKHRDIARVDIIFNHYLEDGTHEAVLKNLLPVDIARFRTRQKKKWPSRQLPDYSMERQLLLGNLLRQFFFVSIFRACVESQTSEHSTRLRTMQSAEQNIEKQHEAVTAHYRRARQAEITNELIEVVAGFSATEAELDQE